MYIYIHICELCVCSIVSKVKPNLLSLQMFSDSWTRLSSFHRCPLHLPKLQALNRRSPNPSSALLPQKQTLSHHDHIL